MFLFLWSLKVDAIHPDSLPLMTKPIVELHSRGRKGDGKEELAQLLCVIGLEVGLWLQSQNCTPGWAHCWGLRAAPRLSCHGWIKQNWPPQPVLLLCWVRRKRPHVHQQPRNQVTLLAKLTCLEGKRSELGCRMILLLYPFFTSLKTRVLLLLLSPIVWPSGMSCFLVPGDS